MTYFTEDKEYDLGFEHAYKKYFLKVNNESKVNIAKYVSLVENEIGLERLKEHNPNCKIIYIWYVNQ